MSDREDYIYQAKLAEHTERYDEMAKAMLKVAHLDHELTEEERILLYVAFRNTINPKRASWRTIHKIERKEQKKGSEDKLEMIRQHRLGIETEIKEICQNIIHVLDMHLIPIASSKESKVFYYKMKTDYYRYLIEITTGNERKEAVKNCLDAHTVRKDIAKSRIACYRFNQVIPCFEILSAPLRGPE